MVWVVPLAPTVLCAPEAGTSFYFHVSGTLGDSLCLFVEFTNRYFSPLTFLSLSGSS